MGKKYQVEGYWDCSACHTKGIKGSKRECPNCGKPRGEDVQFYLKEFGVQYAVSKLEESDKPDWLCDFCGSYNPDSAKKCLSCGADREATNKDYSQIRDTHTYSSVDDYDSNGVDDSSQISDEDRDKMNYHREKEDREKKRQKNHNISKNYSTKKDNESGFSYKDVIFTKQTAIILAILTVVFSLVYYFFVPRNVELQVQSVAWERHINIDRWTTVEESDWTVPPHARVYDERSEVHHYDRVFDHNEVYYEEVGEQVIDHYKTVTSKRDLGNGKFEVVENQEPVYKTVYHKEKREKPVYKDVPVYETKYYYKLERWKHYRSVDTSGTDYEPYFGEYALAEGQGEYNVGSERLGSEKSKYTVTGLVDGKEVTYEIKSLNWWKTMEIGSIVKGVTTNSSNVLSPQKGE